MRSTQLRAMEKTCHAWQRIIVSSLFPFLHHKFPDPDIFAVDMQQLMQNPEMLQQMINSNPMLQQMMQRDPMVGQMMQNPAMMQSMMQMMSNLSK